MRLPWSPSFALLILAILSPFAYAQNLQSIRAAMQSSLNQQKYASNAQSQAAGSQVHLFRSQPRILLPRARQQVPVAGCESLPESQIAQMVDAAGQREGVNPALIREVVRQESGGQPCAVSVKGAQGLMQLMPDTQARFGVMDPFSPHESIAAGTKLLRQLLDRYQGNLKLVLSAYNAGTEAVDRVRAVPNIPETQGYVSAILKRLGR